jgi:hypothetical protein
MAGTRAPSSQCNIAMIPDNAGTQAMLDERMIQSGSA